jgi:hypothetical protein
MPKKLGKAERGDERAQLLDYLDGACAAEPELLATVHALAEAEEIDLLRLIRDFRDNLPGKDIRARHGPDLDERLRIIHRIYVECARRVREERDRPVRARKCYESRMLARRDNYQALLDDPGESIPDPQRQAFAALLQLAREKVPYESLPARLGRDPDTVREEVLQLRQRFKDWTARRKVRAE